MKKKLLARAFMFLALVNVVTFLCVSAARAASPGGGASANKLVRSGNLFYSTVKVIVKPVTGKVTDEKGRPLIGVSVTEQGARSSSITDTKGAYTISVSSDDAVLIFSYIGYNTKLEPVNGRSVVDVSLEPKNTQLGEIIVTALGIKREAKKLGYAAEKVKVDEISTNRTTNMANALEGKVAGLDITPPSAGPGGSTKIRLRGQSSFQGDNSPLIVLNGLPLSQGASSANSYTQTTDQGDNIQQINPDDIESMTVLKGATAAALYGSRASNGAIIITTKTGNKNEGIGVEFTSNFTVDQALDYTDFQKVYGQGENNVRPASQGQAQSSGAWSFGEKFDGQPTYQFDGVQRPYSPAKSRVSTFFRLAKNSTNTLALSGGGQKGSFRVSYSDQYAQGIVPNNSYHKRIFNVGLNYNLTPKLSAQVYANYDHEFNNNPPIVGIQAQSIPAAVYRFANSIDFNVLKAGAVNSSGNETPTSRFSTVTNPYWMIAKQFTRQTKDHLLGTAAMRYQFFDWLYLQGRVNMDYLVTPFEQNTPTGTAAVSPAPSGQFNGNYNVSNSTSRQMNMDFLLGGGHKWGNFSFDATFGGNTFPSYFQNFSEAVTNFYVRDLYTIGNGVTTNTSSYTISKSTINSLYGTAEFGYKTYLFLNLTGRNDWFSVLSPEHNHYFYPSVSGSFVFSEFLKNPPGWLNFGKIRASYANVGSANGIGAYANSLTFALAPSTFNGAPLGSINNTTTPNAALKPYSVKEKEIGLELHMFNNRVNVDVAAYEKQTTNQILSVVISNASGYTGSVFNLGSLQNRGLEFNLELIPVKTSKFTWITDFNTATNHSKVLALASGQQQLTVGTGEFFGAIVDQVGKPLNQIQGSDYKKDANGNYVLAAGKVVTGTNTLFGSALPTATGGWMNTFKYKRFSLFAQIDYKAGGKMLSSSNLNWLREGLSKPSLVGREGGVVFKGVTATGDPNTTAVNAEDFYASYRSQNVITPFVYSSSFIKLRNVALTYDFTNLLKSKYVKGLVMSAVCHNVLIIKKYVPNLDPEAIQSSGDNLAGYEQAALPTTRTFGLNLNVKF